MPGEIAVTAKGLRWHATGHPWIYTDDVAAHAPAESGGVVRVVDPHGRYLGQAFYNARSKIALRFVTREDEPVDLAFWRRRILAAIARRRGLESRTNACRIVSSEADGVPGLVVDRYGDWLCVQTLALGVERLQAEIVGILVEALAPRGVIERNDSAVRRLEGLEESKRVLHRAPPGERPPPFVECFEEDVRYLVDLWDGQKTGAYLDQRENRAATRRYAAGGRVLDAFAYTGLFGLHAARAGAAEVISVDSSAAALELVARNAALNGLATVRALQANVFDFLKEAQQRGESFDLVVLDPPAFAKSRGEVEGAVRGYRELNRRGLGLLRPGGTLVTCSCSYNFSEELLLEALRRAAVEARREVFLLEKRTQSLDHPVLLTAPQTQYLKCLIVQAG